jgi:hypothetical protein
LPIFPAQNTGSTQRFAGMKRMRDPRFV